MNTRLRFLTATSALALGAFRDEGDPPPFDLQKALSDPKSKQTLMDWAEREIAAGLKTKNQELIGKLLKFKVGGTDEAPVYLDPSEASRAMEAVKALDPSGQGDVNKAIEKAVEGAVAGMKRDLEHKDVVITGLQKDLVSAHDGRHSLLLENTLDRSLLKSGVNDKKKHLHDNYLRQFLKVEIDPATKKEKITVLGDDKASVRYGANGPMTVEEFIKEYSTREGVEEDWNSDVNGGSGAGAQQHMVVGDNGKVKVEIDPKLPATERLRRMREAQAEAQGIGRDHRGNRQRA